MLEAFIADNDIVITASRAPSEQDESAATVSVIDEARIKRLGEPLLPAFLRLVPSTSVSTSGPAGSLTQVRIRGAEANHTLLFIDGIRVNDPASGNQPRFELLNADIASRIEVVRGPQSALWGSEAIGGVIAVNGVNADRAEFAAATETGSFGFWRATASASLRSSSTNTAAAIGWQKASGIDSFDGSGDRDGYRNLSARVRGSVAVSSGVELGAAALLLSGRSEFDGFNPVTFRRADTLDSSRNRLAAGRVWSRFGYDSSPWAGQLFATLLGSSNRNLLAENEINRTRGGRWTLGGQVERRLSTESVAHRFIAAADHEAEQFRARDIIYGGFSNQERDRSHQSLTVEWRSSLGPLHGGVAVRHDRFNRFHDATSLRASLLAKLGGGFALAGSYGEGVAQPTFFDLYGFFPGSFVGNPDLKPESSRGVELGLRYLNGPVGGAISWYRQRLRDEIVDLFDGSTFLSTTANREETSRRSGIEAEIGWTPGGALRLTAHYAYLDATEPGALGSSPIRELRRPRHSGAIAADGNRGRLTYGLSIGFSGASRDMDFDSWPATPVRLRSFWLAGARVSFKVSENADLSIRAANMFDKRYQEVIGYRTEGRSIHAGIRLASRR
ncbi:MAG TPA: TonB-dependent receptor [Sphingomicrobium sp.]|nr:TonB-dependent receptor [Sphingomicrobium sp.]